MNRGGAYVLYPNLYVFLAARSGLRKGLPVDVARKLVERSKTTKVIAGRGSIQGIINDLSQADIKENGLLEKNASGFIVSGEFSQAILDDDDAMTILTNLYDGHFNDEFKNMLKSGHETLRNPYITLLAGSAPAHFQRFFTKRELEGGFLARTLMIYETKRANVNALVKKVQKPIDYDGLAKYLHELGKIKGEVVWSDEAGDIFEDWYNKFEEPEEDATGTANRIHDTIIKVAMLLSVSESFELIIHPHHIREAMTVCFECQVNTNRVIMKSGDHPQAGQTKLILDAFLKAENYELRRTKILSRFWGSIDSLDLDRIIDTLRQANAIEEPRRIVHDTVYKLKDEIVAQYLNYEQSMNGDGG